MRPWSIEAARGELIHNDDTAMKVLSSPGDQAPEEACRKGVAHHRPGQPLAGSTNRLVRTETGMPEELTGSLCSNDEFTVPDWRRPSRCATRQASSLRTSNYHPGPAAIHARQRSDETGGPFSRRSAPVTESTLGKVSIIKGPDRSRGYLPKIGCSTINSTVAGVVELENPGPESSSRRNS